MAQTHAARDKPMSKSSLAKSIVEFSSWSESRIECPAHCQVLVAVIDNAPHNHRKPFSTSAAPRALHDCTQTGPKQTGRFLLPRTQCLATPRRPLKGGVKPSHPNLAHGAGRGRFDRRSRFCVEHVGSVVPFDIVTFGSASTGFRT